MKMAGVFIGITLLAFAAIYFMTNQNKQAQTASNFLTSTPTPPPTGGPTVPENERITAKSATIRTAKGNIEVELYASEAAKTVTNFSTLAKRGFYNNLTFHRVEDWVVQGGDPKGNGTGGNDNLPTEISDRSFVKGSVGVARKLIDPKVSNDSQFFIVKKDSTFLDGQYTNFGIVIDGMDVVDQIEIGDKILGIDIQ